MSRTTADPGLARRGRRPTAPGGQRTGDRRTAIGRSTVDRRSDTAVDRPAAAARAWLSPSAALPAGPTHGPAPAYRPPPLRRPGVGPGGLVAGARSEAFAAHRPAIHLVVPQRARSACSRDEPAHPVVEVEGGS
jgi:hypothetical protein